MEKPTSELPGDSTILDGGDLTRVIRSKVDLEDSLTLPTQQQMRTIMEEVIQVGNSSGG